jgi:hypothetical protein
MLSDRFHNTGTFAHADLSIDEDMYRCDVLVLIEAPESEIMYGENPGYL